MHGLIISTKEDIDNLSTTFRAVYINTRDRWGYSARISYLLEMIKYCYSIPEWDLLDPREINNSILDSKMIDFYIDFVDGKDVNFLDVWKEIKKECQFTRREIDLIESGNIDERLWAIFNVLLNPNLNIKYF